MADSRTLKLLLVEDNIEDENLIREALIEVEEGRQWGRWSSCYLAHADRLSDALDHIRGEQFDAILLNLSLPDAPALLDAFLKVYGRADGAPIVILADEDDPVTAQRLIREGAQDVVVKSELECAPLARSIRHAIERLRRTHGQESRWFLDELTGTYNRKGFLHVGAHLLQLARKFGQPVALAALDFEQMSGAKEASDLALIRAAEVARIIFPEESLVGRLEALSLCVLAVGLSDQDARARASKLTLDLRSALGSRSEPRFRLAHVDRNSPAGIEDLLQNCQREAPIPAMLAD